MKARLPGVLVVMLVLACTGLGLAGAANAATIAVSAHRDGDAIAIHASALVNASTAATWSVLTDYARYPDFIPNLFASRIVSRKGNVVTVEQSGTLAFWLLTWPVNVTFDVTESPQTGVRSVATAGSLRALTSSYTLLPVAGGTQLDFSGRVVPDFALFADLEQKALEQTAERQFQALTDEMERQGALRPVAPAAGGQLHPANPSPDGQ